MVDYSRFDNLDVSDSDESEGSEEESFRDIRDEILSEAKTNLSDGGDSSAPDDDYDSDWDYVEEDVPQDPTLRSPAGTRSGFNLDLRSSGGFLGTSGGAGTASRTGGRGGSRRGQSRRAAVDDDDDDDSNPMIALRRMLGGMMGGAGPARGGGGGGGGPTGAHPHVKVHPGDNCRGLNSLFLEEDPQSFVPRVSPMTGTVEVWGTEDGFDTGMAGMMRQMTTQSLYGFLADGEWGELGPPEQQFVGVLMEKKQKLMEAQMPSRKPLFTRDFTLRVALVDHPGTGGSRYSELCPAVWRRVRVSGGCTLRTLHDRVLGPAMGWTRNYHGYMFTELRDGAQYGPKDSQAIDMMHAKREFIDYLSDDGVRLGQVLSKPGDKLMYVYDLGDHWRHEVTLEDVVGEAESTGEVKVLSGLMACPPEDSSGFEGMGCGPYQEHILDAVTDGLGNKRKDLPKKVQIECCSANNILEENKKRGVFDPFAFDLEAARARVRAAVKGKASVAGGELKYNHRLHPGPSGDGSFLGRGPRQRGTRADERPDSSGCVASQVVREATAKDPKRERVCANCGSPNNLKKCARCLRTDYCSAKCQKAAWSEHKQTCKELQEQPQERKKESRRKESRKKSKE